MTNSEASLVISTGEALLFSAIAVVMITLTIFGLLVTRRAVYSVVCIIVDMVCLAFLYTMLEAPFMGVVQVAVYTGAILMMFLFVLMMIGVDGADTTHETLRGQRLFAVLAGLGFAAIGAGAIIAGRTPAGVGMSAANEQTNPKAVAASLFGNHVLTLELTGILLIVAALGAMTLTHRERVRKQLNQEELMEAKMEAYAATGRHIGQRPAPGVYAESNSAAAPALTAGGAVVQESVNRILRIRGQEKTLEEISPIAAARAAAGLLDGPGATSTAQATMLGMPGEGAPDYSSHSVLEEAPAYGEISEPLTHVDVSEDKGGEEK